MPFKIRYKSKSPEPTKILFKNNTPSDSEVSYYPKLPVFTSAPIYPAVCSPNPNPQYLNFVESSYNQSSGNLYTYAEKVKLNNAFIIASDVITTAIFGCRHIPDQLASANNTIHPDILGETDNVRNNYLPKSYLRPIEKYFGNWDPEELANMIRPLLQVIDKQLACDPRKIIFFNVRGKMFYKPKPEVTSYSLNPMNMQAELNAKKIDDLNSFVITISDNELNDMSTTGSLAKFILKEMFRQLISTKNQFEPTDMNNFGMLVCECVGFSKVQPMLAINDTHCWLCFVEYFKPLSVYI